jgi:Clp amino terminal domain, pathogenicity island component
MADQFDRFTEQAKRALVRSQQEAQRLHHTHIGTEHLLLGLVRDEESVAVKVLARLGVAPRQVRRAAGRDPRPALGFSPVTRAAFVNGLGAFGCVHEGWPDPRSLRPLRDRPPMA